LLAVENLRGYPVDFLEPVLERSAASRCVDVGHLWADGQDPAPCLQAALPRTRVIHVHGIAERDHKSLARVPPPELAAVLEILLERGYSGVLTIEVFSEEDLFSSLQALGEALEMAWGKV
jgi:sugar phosphate isomerase/epimerase